MDMLSTNISLPYGFREQLTSAISASAEIASKWVRREEVDSVKKEGDRWHRRYSELVEAHRNSQDDARFKCESLRAELACLKAERDKLAEWKESMLAVESEWKPEEVAKALNLPLGTSIRAGILPAVQQLRANLETAREMREDFRESVANALTQAGAPTHHPDIGAPARKPMMPQERIAWLRVNLDTAQKTVAEMRQYIQAMANLLGTHYPDFDVTEDGCACGSCASRIAEEVRELLSTSADIADKWVRKEEMEEINEAIRRSGMGKMRCSNGLFIAYRPEVDEEHNRKTTEIINRNIELERELEQARREKDVMNSERDYAMGVRDGMVETIATLRAALRRHGKHHADCEAVHGAECTCGLSAALGNSVRASEATTDTKSAPSL